MGRQRPPAAGERIRKSRFAYSLYVEGRYLLFHLLTCFHSTLAQSHTLQPRHLANVFLQLLQRQRLVVNGQTTYFQFVTHYY